MAWRNGARLSSKHIKSMNRRWHALRPENPHGVPRSVMKQLAAEQLPPTKEAYQARYNELMAAKQKE